MSVVAIYPNVETGGVYILMPNLDCGLSVEEIVQKDLPLNTPCKIIDAAQLVDRDLDALRWEEFNV